MVSRFYGSYAEQAENLVVAGTKVPWRIFYVVMLLAQQQTQLKVNTDDGIILGSGNQVALGVEGQIGVIQFNTSGASLDETCK